MTPTQALTPQALMELADDYAKATATARLESLHGTSKSFTEQCVAHAAALREQLNAALSAAPVEPVAPVAWRWMPTQHFPEWVYSDDPDRAAKSRKFMGAGNVHPLYAAPVPAEPALTWQPIETAPKDGQFLVYMPTDDRQPMQVAKWHPNVKVIGGVFAFDAEPPTHWMPLPSAPAAPQG